MLKHKKARHIFSDGFALPTIMIAAVVMTVVLLAGLTASSSVISSVEQQYVQKVVRDTGESGVVVARECILAGETSWTALHTGDSCAGGNTCTGDACYVVNDTENNVRTWFEIGPPTAEGVGYKVEVTAHYERLRASDGSVYDSASDTLRSLIVPSDFTITAFAGGQHAVCAITDASLGYCLGGNDSHVRGISGSELDFSPTFEPVRGSIYGVVLTSIDTNALHSCAIASGAIHCWGTDHQGALGNGAGGNQTVSDLVDASGVLSGKTMTTVMTAGTGDSVVDIYAHTCALDSDGYAYCWGSNGNSTTGGGQLGNGTYTNHQSPVAVGGGYQYSAIDGGKWHTCAIRTNGKLYCWGADNNGQIGNGSTVTHETQPVAVQGDALDLDFAVASFTKLATGLAHNCAIDGNTDQMWCWGQNTQGQLGNGTEDTSHIAVKVTLPGSETGWSDVVASSYYTCGLALSGNVYCWGGTGIVGNLNGQIGDGSTSGANRLVPTAVDTSGVLNGKTLTNIWNTWNSSIVQDNTGHYYSWGINNYAQLGTAVRNDPKEAYSPIDPVYYNDPSTVIEEGASIVY